MTYQIALKRLAVSLAFFIATLVFLSAYAGGASAPSKTPVPSFRKPKSSAVRYYAKNGWVINGEAQMKVVPGSKVTRDGSGFVWDLGGAILDGTKQTGKGDQKENQEKLMSVRVKVTIKNGFVHNNKNALTIYEPGTRIENITFTEIGEDAIATSDGCRGCQVVNSEFINTKSTADKAIQFNEAKDALIQGNLVYGGITCMRIGDSDTTQVSEVAKVSGNHFVGCDTAMNASKITVVLSGNKFSGVRLEKKTSNGAKFK